MHLSCPAKINLHLRVGRRRGSDGFHPLLTWMVTVGLFDTLTVEALPHATDPVEPGAVEPAGGDRTRAARTTDPPGGSEQRDGQPPPGRERAGAAAILRLITDLPGLPTGGDNLVVRAAELLADAVVTARRCSRERASTGGGAGQARTGSSDKLLSDTGADAARRGGGEAIGEEGRADAAGRDATGRVRDGRDDKGTSVGVAAVGGPNVERPAQVDGEVARAGTVGAVLEKRIPLGAGLGGGSSDAARTLDGLNALWRAGLGIDELSRLAARLGSDVPFFLRGPSSVCTGRGEIVVPVAPPQRARWAVLVLPDVHMPTGDVYRRFDEMNLGFDDMIKRPPPWHEWASLPAEQLLRGLVNDLERPAFDIRPDLGALRREIELGVSRPVRLSGSGSSLLTLFDAQAAAERAAADVTARFGVRALAAEVGPVIRDDLNRNFAPA